MTVVGVVVVMGVLAVVLMRTRQEDSPPRICDPKLLVITPW